MSYWQLQCAEMKQRSAYLYQSGLWSDCAFKIGEEEIIVKAHKLIMAMASPVFGSMFYGKVAADNPIPIYDTRPDVFKTLLEYIYSDHINLSNIRDACDLHNAAVKWRLPYVKEMCIKFISSNLNADNVCCIYELACQSKELHLQDDCVKIFKTLTKDIIKTESFKQAKLSTIVKIFSMKTLNIDSELDLFKAAVKYADAQDIEGLKRCRNNSEDMLITSEGPSSPKSCRMNTTELAHNSQDFAALNDETSTDIISTENISAEPMEMESQHETEHGYAEKSSRDNIKTDSKTDDESKPLKLKNKARKQKYRDLIHKIRFLTLSPQEFAECTHLLSLLSSAEVLALSLNISSKDTFVPMPRHFSTCMVPRNVSLQHEKERQSGTARISVQNFRSLTKFESSPFYVRDLAWTLMLLHPQETDEDIKRNMFIIAVTCFFEKGRPEWIEDVEASVSFVSQNYISIRFQDMKLKEICDIRNHNEYEAWFFKTNWSDVTSLQGLIEDNTITCKVYVTTNAQKSPTTPEPAQNNSSTTDFITTHLRSSTPLSRAKILKEKRFMCENRSLTPVLREQRSAIPSTLTGNRSLTPLLPEKQSITPKLPENRGVNSTMPVKSSVTPTAFINRSVASTVPVNRSPTPSMPANRCVTPTMTVIRCVTPTMPVNRSPTTKMPVNRCVTPTMPVNRSPTLTMPVKCCVTPTMHVNRSPTPTMPVKRSLTPTMPVTRSVTPTMSVNRCVTPTVPVNRSPNLTMPVKCCVTPTMHVNRSATPTMPVTRSVTPTMPINRSLTPTMPVTRSVTPTMPVNRSTTPTMPVTRSVTPTMPVNRSTTPTMLVTRCVTPTMLVTRSVTPTMPVNRSTTPTMPVTRSVTPTVPVNRSTTPTMPVTRSVTPTMPVNRNTTPTIPVKNISNSSPLPCTNNALPGKHISTGVYVKSPLSSVTNTTQFSTFKNKSGSSPISPKVIKITISNNRPSPAPGKHTIGYSLPKDVTNQTKDVLRLLVKDEDRPRALNCVQILRSLHRKGYPINGPIAQRYLNHLNAISINGFQVLRPLLAYANESPVAVNKPGVSATIMDKELRPLGSVDGSESVPKTISNENIENLAPEPFVLKGNTPSIIEPTVVEDSLSKPSSVMNTAPLICLDSVNENRTEQSVPETVALKEPLVSEPMTLKDNNLSVLEPLCSEPLVTEPMDENDDVISSIIKPTVLEDSSSEPSSVRNTAPLIFRDSVNENRKEQSAPKPIALKEPLFLEPMTLKDKNLSVLKPLGSESLLTEPMNVDSASEPSPLVNLAPSMSKPLVKGNVPLASESLAPMDCTDSVLELSTDKNDKEQLVHKFVLKVSIPWISKPSASESTTLNDDIQSMSDPFALNKKTPSLSDPVALKEHISSASEPTDLIDIAEMNPELHTLEDPLNQSATAPSMSKHLTLNNNIPLCFKPIALAPEPKLIKEDRTLAPVLIPLKEDVSLGSESVLLKQDVLTVGSESMPFKDVTVVPKPMILKEEVTLESEPKALKENVSLASETLALTYDVHSELKTSAMIDNVVSMLKPMEQKGIVPLDVTDSSPEPHILDDNKQPKSLPIAQKVNLPLTSEPLNDNNSLKTNPLGLNKKVQEPIIVTNAQPVCKTSRHHKVPSKFSVVPKNDSPSATEAILACRHTLMALKHHKYPMSGRLAQKYLKTLKSLTNKTDTSSSMEPLSLNNTASMSNESNETLIVHCRRILMSLKSHKYPMSGSIAQKYLNALRDLTNKTQPVSGSPSAKCSSRGTKALKESSSVPPLSEMHKATLIRQLKKYKRALMSLKFHKYPMTGPMAQKYINKIGIIAKNLGLRS